jgi:ABC transporter substrate binding protein (PQQ-dependent alcohol dehydrogenase system)
MRAWFRFAILGVLVAALPLAADPLKVEIGLLSRLPAEHIPLTALEPRVQDDGVAGAEQGIGDNNTTGRFTGQEFRLHPVLLEDESRSATDAFRDLHEAGVRLFLVNLSPDELLTLADLPEAADSLLFNIGARDDRLRVEECRSNLLHTAPSRAMVADALAQFLAWKRWPRWFLVVGRGSADRDYAAALDRAARRFGGKIVARKTWTFDAGSTRTDSGHVHEQQVVNAFTQVGDYDILLVADEADDFGEYLNYRTYRPRPLGGTQGLAATSWSGVFEQWGATQFQRRFRANAGRWMTPLDYAAWLAVRSIGESATRTGSANAPELRDHMLSPAFKLAAFKGMPVTYRDWNGQMRQPLLIVSERILVSVSPQEGFLHQVSPLDTLGYDRPEVHCGQRR